MSIPDGVEGIYERALWPLVARVLSLQNRNPYSRTYGCLDRNYWHFKTIVDFPSATYQQAVAGFARLWQQGAFGGLWHRHPVLREAAVAGIRYWCRIQNADGSFNEYYENDRSFCPTAHTAWAVACAYAVLRETLSASERTTIEQHLLRAGRWLTKHRNPAVQNQMLASMVALERIGALTGAADILAGFEARRHETLSAQTEEGWFSEYGGADIGYSFLDLDLLALYLSYRNDDQVRLAASRLLNFLSCFLHPDGTTGGEYGSRCTQHLFPFGVEFFARMGLPKAEEVRNWVRASIAGIRGMHPALVDDKYAAYFYFNSYVEAALLSPSATVPAGPQPTGRPGLTFFAQAKLARAQIGRATAWFGLGRNGVCRVYYDNRLVYADSGYLLITADGRLGASQVGQIDSPPRLVDEGDRVTVETSGLLGLVNDAYPLVRWLVPFKLFCRTLLRIDRLGYWFHAFVKRRQIVRCRLIPIRLTRRIELTVQGVRIQDRLAVEEDGVGWQTLRKVRQISVPHSPSSRFWLPAYFSDVRPLEKEEQTQISASGACYEEFVQFDGDGGGNSYASG